MKHIIEKIIFDTSMNDQSKVNAVQDRISDVFNRKLTLILEEIFNRYSNPHEIIRIDRLEIDLGNIGEQYLEDEIIRKLSHELPLALSQIITESKLYPHKKGVEVAPISHSQLELLQFFLQNGAFPWWYKADEAGGILEILHQLIAEKPHATAQLLRKLGKQKNIRQRLIYQFSNELLEKIIRLLIPKHALSINTFINKLQQQFQRNQQPQISTHQFKNKIYAFTLAYIFDSDSLFTINPFKVSLQQHLMREWDLDTEASEALFGTLVEAEKTPQAAENRQSQLELLRYYLKEGRLPEWSYVHNKESLEDILLNLLDNAPQQLTRFLRLINSPHQISQRIIYQFSPQIVARLLDLLSHEHAIFITHYLNNLNKIYGYRSGQKPQMQQLLQKGILSFFLQKNPQFSPSNFNQHITQQLLQKQIIEKKEVAEVFDLVTTRSASGGQQRVENSPSFAKQGDIWNGDNTTKPQTAPNHFKPSQTTPNNFKQTQSTTSPHSLVTAIEYFLEEGRIPTNLSENLQQLSFNQLFAKLLEEQPANLIALLRQTFLHENRQKRLIQQLSEQLFIQTIELIQPQFAPQIQRFKNIASEIYQENNEFFSSNAKFQTIQRSKILQYTLTAPTTTFNLQDFIQTILQEITTESTEPTELQAIFNKNSPVIHRYTQYGQSTEYPTPNIEYPISNTEHPTPNIEHPQESIETTEHPPSIQETSLVETIAFFLKEGRLPEQIAKKWRNLNFEQLVRELLEKQTTKTLPLLQQAAKTIEAQERLIQQLSEKTLLQLLQVLQPNFWQSIKDFSQLIWEVQKNNAELFIPSNRFRTLQWQFILDFLLQNQIDGFQPKLFIARLLQKLIKEGNENQQQLLEILHIFTTQKKASQNLHTWLEITHELVIAYEHPPSIHEHPLSIHEHPQTHLNLFQSIAYFLQNQQLPPKVEPNIEGLSFVALFEKLLQQEPRKVLPLLRKSAAKPSQQIRLIQHLPEKTLQQLIQTIQPNFAGLVFTYQLALQKLEEKHAAIIQNAPTSKQLQWQGTLRYLLEVQTGNFDIKSFVKTALQTTITSNKNQNQQLLASLQIIVQEEVANKQYRFYPLKDVLDTIKEVVENSPSFEKHGDIWNGEQESIETTEHPEEASTAITHFLQHQQLPPKTTKSFEEIFAEFLQQAPREALPLLKKTTATQTQQLRLVKHLSEKTLQQLIQTIQSKSTDFVVTFHLAIQKLEEQQPAILRSTQSLKEIQWQGTIQYILEEQTRSFEPKKFVETSLQAIAVITKSQASQLAQALQTVVQEQVAKKQVRFYQLADVLEIVDSTLVTNEREEVVENSPSFVKHGDIWNGDKQESPTSSRSLVESIAYFLQHARLPDNIESKFRGWTFQNLFIELLEKQTRKALPLLRNVVKVAEIRERLIVQLSDEVLQHLVQILQPKFAHFIHSFGELIRQFQEAKPQLFQAVSDPRLLQWEYILMHLLELKGEKFHPKSFIISAIQQLAIDSQEIQEQFLQLLKAFVEQLEEVDAVVKDWLMRIQSTVASTLSAPKQRESQVARTQLTRKKERTANLVQSIAYFLLNEKLPPKVEKELEGLNFEQLVKLLIQQEPQKIPFFLKKTMENESEQVILIRHLSEASLARLLQKVASNILQLAEKLRSILSKWQNFVPQIFRQRSDFKNLQWKMLIAYVTAETTVKFDSFLLQFITELTTFNTIGGEERNTALQSLQRLLQKQVEETTYSLPQNIGFYLRYEEFPIQVEADIEGITFPELFQQFLQATPKQVLPFLRNTLQDSAQQARLIEQLPTATLEEMLQTLEPDFAGFVATFQLLIERLPNVSEQSLKWLQWEGILVYWVENQSTAFDSEKYLQWAIQKLGISTQRELKELLEVLKGLVEEAVEGKEMRFVPFLDVLETVDGEQLMGNGGIFITNEREKVVENSPSFVKYGNIWNGDETEDNSTLVVNEREEFIEHLQVTIVKLKGFLETEPHKSLPYLRKVVVNKAMQLQLIEALDEATLEELVEKVQPNFAGLVATVRLLVERLESEKSVGLDGQKSLKVLQWEGVVGYLLEIGGGSFDLKRYLERAIGGMVSSVSAVEGLIAEMQQVVQQAVERKEYRFYPLVDALKTVDGGRLTVDGKGVENSPSFVKHGDIWNGDEIESSTLVTNEREKSSDALVINEREEFIEHPQESIASIENLQETIEKLEDFLENEPRKVLPYLRKVTGEKGGRMQLIQALDEERLEELVEKVQPNFAGLMATVRLLVERLEGKKSAGLDSRKSLKVLQWEGVVEYLLEIGGGSFDLKKYLERTIGGMVSNREAVKQLVVDMQRIVQQAVDGKEYRFYPLVEALANIEYRTLNIEHPISNIDNGERKTVDGDTLVTNEREKEVENSPSFVKHGDIWNGDETESATLVANEREESTKQPQEPKEESERIRDWNLEDLLVYFLLHSVLPEHVPTKWKGKSFAELFAELLERSPQKTLPLLRKNVRELEQQQRLIQQLPDKDLEQLLKVMGGNHRHFVNYFKKVLMEVYVAHSGVFRVENKRVFEWQGVIAYFVEGDGSFDRLGFLAFVIRYWADKSSWSATELLEGIGSALVINEREDSGEGALITNEREGQVLEVALRSLKRIANVVFGERGEEQEIEAVNYEEMSTPMEKELERIGLQLNEEEVFDMREVVEYLYGKVEQLAKYTQGEFEGLFRELMQAYPDTTQETVRTLLGDEEVLEKILEELSAETYRSIVELLQPSFAERIQQYLEDMTVMFKEEVTRKELLLYLKEIDEFSFSLADFTHQILQTMVGEDKMEYERMLITSMEYLKMTQLESKNELRKALSELKIKYDVKTGDIKRRGRKRETSLDEKATTKKTLMEETIYVQNAGLVLIYPFLSRYFNFLGMLEKNKFKDEETAHRAVLLLQYLATGFSKSPEHELVLNKLMCGLPLDTPVPAEIDMTEKEKEISGQMLQAIIQNWKRLNNMSVDNFRGSFILRDGKLEEKQKAWHLKVEKKAWDLLLKTLPWGYSLVRLPWMEKMISVEWQE